MAYVIHKKPAINLVPSIYNDQCSSPIHWCLLNQYFWLLKTLIHTMVYLTFSIGFIAQQYENYRKTTVRTTHVLHKTTKRTTQNYAILQTNYLHTQQTQSKKVAHKIWYNDVATYNLHKKLTWCILEMSIFAVTLG